MSRAASKMMVVCLLQSRAADDAYREVRAKEAEEQARYMSWLWRKGIYWAGGPLDAGSMAMEIYTVDSMEEAVKAQRNAPHYRSGVLYDDQYFEWTPRHWPPARPDVNPSSGELLAR